MVLWSGSVRADNDESPCCISHVAYEAKHRSKMVHENPCTNCMFDGREMKAGGK